MGWGPLIRQRYPDLIVLGIFTLYYIIAGILGYGVLHLINIAFVMYCNIMGFIFIYKVIKKNGTILTKGVITIAIALILCFGDFIVWWGTYYEHYEVVNNKILIIEVVPVGWHHTRVKLYRPKFLVYKEPLEVKEEMLKGSCDVYKLGYYKLPRDIGDYLK